MRAILFFCLLVFTSCNEKLPPLERPDDLVSETEMIAVLADIIQIESYIHQKYIQVSKYYETMSASGEAVLKEHNISFERFERSMNYYGGDQDKMIQIYQTVSDTLKNRENALPELEGFDD